MASSYWEDFNGWSGGIGDHKGIIRAHDSGHVSCGPTLSNQDIAAFDPLFWFFHANWDRLWWRWQQAYSGTKLDTFKTLLTGDAFWLVDPVASRLEPFDTSAANMIDLSAMGVEYEHPADEAQPQPEAPTTHVLNAAESFSIPKPSNAVVRLSGIDRLRIPGTFEIVLLKDHEPIYRRAVFQSTTPKLCANCRRNANVDLEFDVPLEDIAEGSISFGLNIFNDEGLKERFPLLHAGDPTIEIRVKMQP